MFTGQWLLRATTRAARPPTIVLKTVPPHEETMTIADEAQDDTLRQRLLAALDDPAAWPRAAEALCAESAVWRCPARGRVIVGRSAVLAQWREDAARLAGARCVTLRHAVSGVRAIHESAMTLRLPPEGVPGVPLPGGTRAELGSTRIVSVVDGRIVEELALETWTPLPE